MSTITREFTKEQLIAKAEERRDHAQHCLTVFPNDEEYAADKRLAEIAMASLEAEPVYFVEIEGDQDINAGRIEGKNRPDLGLLPDGVNYLYAAPPAPVSVPTFEEWCKRTEKKPVGWVRDAMKEAYEACRAAMLQGAENTESRCTIQTAPALDSLPKNDDSNCGNSPAIPDGYVLVPKKLTAENGAKGVLSGEFSETKSINCPECFGDDDCETCDGSGRIEITVPVTWTTIKAIWAKGVEHLAAAPQQEV
ncbi:hypothetical protein V1605_20105 [Enterobacter soli]|uniref:hypothetical protein n=1 Tax=Enterobacter soli TaxID=885040 RepID=UPI001C275F64|nr:hypothetical protein [Enterobacter soli]